MSDTAFAPQSNTFLVTTNASANTASSQPVTFGTPAQRAAGGVAADTGLSNMPPQVRIVNGSAGIVYVSVTGVARVAAAPGVNPTLEFPVASGSATVLSLTQNPNAQGQMFINTIAATASAALSVTFGEGR